MKNSPITKSIIFALSMGCTLNTNAQDNAKNPGDTIIVIGKDGKDGKDGNDNGYSLQLSNHGAKISKKKSPGDKSPRIQTYWGLVDLGLNFIQDQSVYGAGNALTNKYGVQEDWFDLRNGRSWNVNIYPVMVSYKMVKQKKFEINLYSGIGLQIYNFRYKTNLTHYSDPKDKLTNDVGVKFTKNKLSQNFLTVPLMVNFNHKLDKKNWLTYGFGASAGYNLNTWTKQQSAEFGTQKNHDLYNFNEFNVNVIGEIGINSLRFFASYQLTNMYKGSDLKQQPISFGIRFGHI